MMPSSKSKEDTWRTSELEESLREAKSDRKQRERDSEKYRRKEKPRGENQDGKPRRRKEDEGERERHHRDQENGVSTHHKSSKRRDEASDRKRDKDDRHKRDKEDGSREHRHRDDDHRERRKRHSDYEEHDKRPRRKEGDEERSHRKRVDEESKHRRNEGDDERRHHKRDDDDERKHRKHRDDDDDRKHRRHRDDDDERKHRKHRDDDDERKHRKHRDDDDDRKHRRHRDDDDDERKHRRHRDDDDERKHRRHRDDDDERKHRRHRDDDDDERKHRKREDDSNGRRSKPRDEKADEEEARHRRHEERKERKRKEKEEEERKQREEEKKKKREEAEKDSDAYNDYEDDFEDYEDDFDDEVDEDNDDDDDRSDPRTTESKPQAKFTEEMDAVLKAMDAENDKLLNSAESRHNHGNWSDSTESEDKSSKKRPPVGRTFINFVSAKQRTISDKAANKARQRGNELFKLIELDVSAYDIFDLPPVNEYDLYIRSFGGSNTKQAYIQTNEDNTDREIQTEDVVLVDKWTQQPPDRFVTSGGGDDKEDAEVEQKPVDSVKLGQFMQKASQVISVLLEENFAENLQSSPAGSQHSKICVSEAYTELNIPEVLKGCHVTQSYFSPSHNTTLLTVLSQTTQELSALSGRGVMCVWNVNEPSKPTKMLVCASQPLSCCLSPAKPIIAFAGCTDGSLVAWDLREPDSLHNTHPLPDCPYTISSPSYNTAGVLHYENHTSPVVCLQHIVSTAHGSAGGMGDLAGSEGLSFQLASLEENSVINLWVVAEVHHTDPAGSQSDLGLAPSSRIKLIKSSSILLNNPLRQVRLQTIMRSFDLQLLPSNNSHFYTTTSTGCVVHGVRYGGKAPPKAYRMETESLVNVTTLDFSPFPEPVFLAGCEDGSLRLYHVNTDVPLMWWPEATSDGSSVRLVRWCRSRPSVFFVLDDHSTLYIWDLLMDDSGPMKQERIANSRVTSFSLSNDYAATGMGMSGRRPQMAVSVMSGQVEVHTISKQFSALMSQELDEFSTLLQKLI